MFSARLIGSCRPVSRSALGVTRSSDVGGLRLTTASRSPYADRSGARAARRPDPRDVG